MEFVFNAAIFSIVALPKAPNAGIDWWRHDDIVILIKELSESFQSIHRWRHDNIVILFMELLEPFYSNCIGTHFHNVT